ncbi:hypothetical protein [Kitasatospora azatica]|uniref:hypothetical protein n=1 Tax=Kitasatospora azatica TaxID=58347 RepID=UPI00055DFD82|nr:hypothetical protein [Kitasatospora azatica]
MSDSARSTRFVRSTRWSLAAPGLFLLAVLLQVLHGWAFDRAVLEPTRHCHHQGAVPVLAFAAGFAALGLTVGALVIAVRALNRGAGGAGRALLVLLLVVAALLLAYDALALLGDFAPGAHDPFHCGE